MKLAVVLLFLGGAHFTVLRDEIDVVPAGQWRFDEFLLKDQLPATVFCQFRVDPPGKARVELMTAENLQALLRRERYEPIAKATGGKLRYTIGVPGRFAVMVLNDDPRREARVALKLSLDFSTNARYLSPERRLTVILLSFIGFLAVVTLSARKLMMAMRRN